jgi:alkanesulfonate monooxygenase SsuD/methylene tetrahydromethanopterin reductase-like flavin-dependent oxidoreductase (luciferase family)
MLIRSLLEKPCVTFSGRFHDVFEACCRPETVQRPHPPLFVGGSGRRTLELGAREADGISITPTAGADGAHRGIDAAEIDRKMAWIEAAAGERIQQLRIDFVVWECFVTPRPTPVVYALAKALQRDAADVLESPAILVGSVEQIAECLLIRQKRWKATRVTVPAQAIDMFTPVVERLRGQLAT